MSKCADCGKEMLTADGCDYSKVKTGAGVVYQRQRVGDEGWCNPGERCGDCGAKYGHYHHMGCDIERCPICGNQFISCDCDIQYILK